LKVIFVHAANRKYFFLKTGNLRDNFEKSSGSQKVKDVPFGSVSLLGSAMLIEIFFLQSSSSKNADNEVKTEII